MVCNFTPMARHGYAIGVTQAGEWEELLNSDAARYGGSNVGNHGSVTATGLPMHDQPASLTLTLPPLSTLILVPKT